MQRVKGRVEQKASWLAVTETGSGGFGGSAGSW